jgi:hypothetical protein
VVTVLEHDLSVAVHGPEPGDPQIEINVRGSSRLPPEAADRLDGSPTVKDCSRCPDVVVAKKSHIVIRLDRSLGRRLEQGAVGTDDSHMTIRKAARWTLLERSDGNFERGSKEPVVGVEEEQECSAAFPISMVPRRRGSLVLLTNVSDLGERLGDSTRVILRPVIDTTRISRSRCVCARTLGIASARYRAWL